MSAATEFAYLHRLTPAEAVAYLQGRGKLAQTYSWMDLWQDEHAYQFTVSRLARLDILKAMQDGITESVSGDLTRRDWTRDMKALLRREGWWGEKKVVDPETGKTVRTRFDSQRLNLIFGVNVRQAYAAGQWQGIEAAKATHPYVRYITQRDDRVRAAHRAWDGVTLPVDDPFWNTHTPPCDFRCRCRITTMTEEEYSKRSAEGRIKTSRPVEREATFVNKRTGEITKAPLGVNPGFAYNPGKAAMRQDALASLVEEKLSAAGPSLANAARADGLFSK
ncbi:MAG: phage head morphogenesis protein [Candidatus Accumulibacter sp.]|jgi:SPP1 gp7 family putative phage head morphogenesis protein|nr:phage head morphogenesis protein [Accumulibacter sp.]